MIGFVQRLDDEHAGVDWFPGHAGRDVTGKNPGMLPKLKCAADESGFLQRMIDRTRERIRSRHRAGAPAANHPDAGAHRRIRKPQPASAGAPLPAETGAATETAGDIPR